MESQPNPIPFSGSREDSRRHGRIRASGLECSLGEVVNISASGMKLRSPNKKHYLERGKSLSLTLKNTAGAIELTANVQWANGIGGGVTEAGLTWGDLSEETAEALREMIRTAVSESMLPKRAGR